MHRIFVDEVGNSDLASSANDNERYLSLTGVISELHYHDGILTEDLSAFKRDVFGCDNLVLHRRELSRREPPFEALRDNDTRQRFDTGLLTLLSRLDYGVITVVIDKREHQERYRVWRYHPYHYCLAVLLERYVMHLSRIGATGDVMVESRQRIDNEKLESAYQHFYQRGSDWMEAHQGQQVLTSHQLKIKTKEANVAGLQIADLLAHPSFRNLQTQRLRQPMTARFGVEVCRILEVKYLRNPAGSATGWGCKWLP